MKFIALIFSALLTCSAWASNFENGYYSLDILDHQYPSTYGPWSQYSLVIEGNRFKLIEEPIDAEIARPDLYRIYEGTLSKRENSKGEILIMGITETMGLKEFYSREHKGQPADSNDTVKSFSLKLNGNALSRYLTYRPWRLRKHSEGTLTIHLDKKSLKNETDEVQRTSRIQVRKDQTPAYPEFYKVNPSTIVKLRPPQCKGLF